VLPPSPTPFWRLIVRKVIVLEIPYNNKGEELKKKIKIDFISNDVLSRYNTLAEQMQEIYDLHLEVQTCAEELAEVIVNHKLSLKERRLQSLPLKTEMVRLKTEIKSRNTSQVLKDRVALIVIILEDNKITDKDLYSFNFWNKQTESSVAWEFLAVAVVKDTSGGMAKKKVK